MKIESIKKILMYRINDAVDVITDFDGSVYCTYNNKLITPNDARKLYDLYKSQPERSKREDIRKDDAVL